MALAKQFYSIATQRSVEMEVEVPGGSEAVTADTGSEASFKVSQVDIPEEEVDETHLENAEAMFEHLARLPFQVFILSEFGRPIFVK